MTSPWKRLAALSLRQRIVLLFTLLLVVIQGATFLVIATTNSQVPRATINEALGQGERVFRRLMQQNQQQLQQGAAVMSGDFAFRAAIASNDRGTIDSVLRNHGARVGTQTMMLIGLDGQVRVDTFDSGQVGKPFAWPALIATAHGEGAASTVAEIGGHLFQLVVVEVLAPDPIASVAMGFRIDDKVAQELKQQSGLEVSFASSRPGGWQLHASTLDTALQRDLQAASAGLHPGPGVEAFQLGGEEYETRSMTLARDGGRESIAILQRRLADALAPFEKIGRSTVWLGLLGVVLAAVGSALIARKITEPIQRLAQSAQRIEAGDYTHPVAIEQQDEIGALAASFDHMREGIANREARILQLAYEDGLTGLPNRTMFLRHLEQAVALAGREGSPPSVLLLDLDRFKTINDTLGHQVGDRALTEVGQRIRTILRASDCVARLGGDEFGVLLANGGSTRAARVAQKIQSCLEPSIVVEDQRMDVAASIGIAHYPMHGTSASDLVRSADVAMYGAKRANSGYAEFDPVHNEYRASHLTLLGELRDAVGKGELLLHYQPKLGLARDRITEVEALLRWRHPVKGLIPPAEFIPFAEQTGFIGAMTRWVVEAGLRQCGEWHAAGRELRLSINVSARDLQARENLVDTVRQALERFAVPPAMLCIEITESSLMRDPDVARETLRALHDMGVSLSIDDYGTGYSSLAYLRRLEVNELKIDRTFVAGMESDRKNLAIIRSSIELGHNLGLSVTAEGVETEEEIVALRGMGCDFAQGYRISRPMEAADLAAWLDARAAGAAPAGQSGGG